MKECEVKNHLGVICRQDIEDCAGEDLIASSIKFGSSSAKTQEGVLLTCRGCVYFNKLRAMINVPELVTVREYSKDDTLALSKPKEKQA